jgi:biopolymer transport protein ExbB/TolQ
MANASQSQSGKLISWMRRLVTYAVLLLIGFMLGFVPMWVKSRDSASSLVQAASRADLTRTQNTLASAVVAQQLELAKMQNALASAAIDARRGDYESARQSASSFFTSLQAEASKGVDSSLSQAQKSRVEPLFTRRDEIISLLARNDPAAAGQLSDLYVSFREIMSK